MRAISSYQLGLPRPIQEAAGALTLSPDALKAMEDQGYSSLSRYQETASSAVDYWDLLDSARAHPWLRATITAIGRSVIGMNWQLKKEKTGKATAGQKRELEDFFSTVPDREFTNVKDLQNNTVKMYLTAGCFRLFGVAAWEVLRNEFGMAIGYDYVWGIVVPNIDKQGNFKRPAWKVYTDREDFFRPIEYEQPDDLVVFANPDFGGKFYSSDLEAAATFSLPSDIWAMTSYLAMHRDRTAPHDGVWVVPPEIDDDSFKKVQALIYARYRGARNFARTPLVARGDLEFKPTRKGEDEAPYLEGRSISRQEITGVAGMAGSQIGVTEETTRSNLAQVRKQTHEMTIVPIVRFIEESIHQQVCIREFLSPGWWLRFDPPDFLTVIEKSGVAQRLRERGAMNSDEMRAYVLNLPPKPENGGEDDWLYPSNMVSVSASQGGPPLAPEMQPGNAPSDGAPSNDPPRTNDPDQYRDSLEPELASVVSELKQWRTFSLRALKGKRAPRPFHTKAIPPSVRDYIVEQVALAPQPEYVAALFDAAIHAANGAAQ